MAASPCRPLGGRLASHPWRSAAFRRCACASRKCDRQGGGARALWTPAADSVCWTRGQDLRARGASARLRGCGGSPLCPPALPAGKTSHTQNGGEFQQIDWFFRGKKLYCKPACVTFTAQNAAVAGGFPLP